MASLLLASMSGVAGAASGEDGGADPGTETGKTDYAAQAVQAASLEEHYRTVRPTYTLSPYTRAAVSFAADEAVLPEYAECLESGPLDYGAAAAIRQGEEAAFAVEAPACMQSRLNITICPTAPCRSK